MTNGDMIRQMTDEELAVTLMCPKETGMADIDCDGGDTGRNCCQCCLDWLREEVRDDE